MALAESLMEAATPEERGAIMAANPEFVNEQLIVACRGWPVRRRSRARTRSRRADTSGCARWRAPRERPLEGEALQNLANAMYFQRNFAGALRVVRAAARARAAPRRSGRHRRLPSRHRHGPVRLRRLRRGDDVVPRSARDSGEARRRRRDRDDARSAPATSCYLQGEFAASIADYTRSRDLYKRTKHADRRSQRARGDGARPRRARRLPGGAGSVRRRARRGEDLRQSRRSGDGAPQHRRRALPARQCGSGMDGARRSARSHFEAIKTLLIAGRAWQGLGETDLAAGRFARAEDEYRKSARDLCTAAANRVRGERHRRARLHPGRAGEVHEGVASYRRASRRSRRSSGGRSSPGPRSAFRRRLPGAAISPARWQPAPARAPPAKPSQ